MRGRTGQKAKCRAPNDEQCNVECAHVDLVGSRRNFFALIQTRLRSSRRRLLF